MKPASASIPRLCPVNAASGARYLKKFFGSALMDAAIKDAALKNPKKGSGKDSKKRSGKRSKRATKRAPKVSKGVFKGETLSDVHPRRWFEFR
jgi:hypothetical protein